VPSVSFSDATAGSIKQKPLIKIMSQLLLVSVKYICFFWFVTLFGEAGRIKN
jgi:hypothetical protein